MSTQAQLAPAIQLCTPTAGRLLVRRIPGTKLSETIIAPDCVKMTFCQAEVVSVGPPKTDNEGHERPLAVEVGDVIYFGRYTDKEDGEYALIQEADVILRRISLARLHARYGSKAHHNALFDGDRLWQAIDDRIIVQAEEQPQSKVIAPQTAEKQTRRGCVMAVGTGKYPEYESIYGSPDYSHVLPLSVRVGDSVEFLAVTGSEFTMRGERYLVMRDAEVLGVWI